MDVSELLTILAQGESDTVEFKQIIREPRILARVVGAMGNASGGIVVVGFREPDQITGVDADQLSRIHERALDRIHPRPAASLEFVEIEGKSVGVITVGKSSELLLT